MRLHRRHTKSKRVYCRWLATLLGSASAIFAVLPVGAMFKAEAANNAAKLRWAEHYSAVRTIGKIGPTGRDNNLMPSVAQLPSLDQLCNLRADLSQIETAAGNVRQKLASQLGDVASQYEEVELKRRHCGELGCPKEESDRLTARAEILFEQRYALDRAIADFDERAKQRARQQEDTRKQLDELIQGKCL